jgi:hypothetical protein
MLTAFFMRCSGTIIDTLPASHSTRDVIDKADSFCYSVGTQKSIDAGKIYYPAENAESGDAKKGRQTVQTTRIFGFQEDVEIEIVYHEHFH